MGAHAAPQLQRDTSEQGASSTAGGAYASRDDPRAQAAQPTEGKSDEELVQVRQGSGGCRRDGECWVRFAVWKTLGVLGGGR